MLVPRASSIGDHRAVLRLSIGLFLVQAGFHGFTASIPLALARAGRNDAEIGALVGLAALVQILAALAGGALIDRVGAIRMFLVGGTCYLVACALLLISGVGPEATLPLAVARILQGTGTGVVVPAALSVVPSLVSLERRGISIATAGASHNLTLVVIPPLSIFVLDLYGLAGVSVFVAAFVAIGLLIVLARPFELRAAGESSLAKASRRFGFAYRSSWLAPLAVMTLWVVHWGVLSAYLPQRAEAAGANIALLFVADGVFVLLARIPAGWLADRVRPVIPVVAGVALTAVALTMLFAPPTTLTLILAGSLTGLGAALIVQPLMLALTNRSTDADRGSAFAWFNAMFAVGITLGSIGTAPVVERVGFTTLLAVAFVALVASAGVALADRALRTRPRQRADRPRDYAAEAGTPIGP